MGLAQRLRITQEGMMQGPATIARIYRYPVKGLSPEPLDRTALAPGQTVPLDRAYAIENGPSGFDPAAPAYFPKQRFLMLMRNERLASLATQLDETTHTLTIRQDGSTVVQGDLRTAPGRTAIEQFFASFCSEDLRGPPKILAGSGRNSMGFGHQLAQTVGGELARMDHQWNYFTGLPDPRYPGTNRGLSAANMHGIIVNAPSPRVPLRFNGCVIRSG